MEVICTTYLSTESTSINEIRSRQETARRKGTWCLTTPVPISNLMSSLEDVNKVDPYKGDRACPSVSMLHLRTAGRILIHFYTRGIIRRSRANPILIKFGPQNIFSYESIWNS
jgi:hypothetical protein